MHKQPSAPIRPVGTATGNPSHACLTTLLLRHTDGAATAAGRLGVLTAHAQAPVVTETTVVTDLLETLKVLTHLVVKTVGEDLGVGTVLDVLLPVKEPGGDLVLQGVLDDVDDALKLIVGELTSALVHVDIGLLAHQVGVPTTHTLDGSQGEHDLLLPLNVGVEETKDVLELVLVGDNEGLHGRKRNGE